MLKYIQYILQQLKAANLTVETNMENFNDDLEFPGGAIDIHTEDGAKIGLMMCLSGKTFMRFVCLDINTQKLFESGNIEIYFTEEQDVHKLDPMLNAIMDKHSN